MKKTSLVLGLVAILLLSMTVTTAATFLRGNGDIYNYFISEDENITEVPAKYNVLINTKEALIFNMTLVERDGKLPTMILARVETTCIKKRKCSWEKE